MKSLACLVVLAVVSVAISGAVPHPRGCIFINGHCHRECEEGTQMYSSNCGPYTPEATCDEPNPQTDESARLCDFFGCYCAPPTVRDPKTNKCVVLDDCTKNE